MCIYIYMICVYIYMIYVYIHSPIKLQSKLGSSSSSIDRWRIARNPADWLMDVLSGVVPNEKLADFRPAMLFDIWNTKKNDINRRPPTGVGWLGWWGGQKMMPSIPLLSFKSRKGLIISHASLIPRYAKYCCNFLPTNLGSYLKWSHSFATFRLRHGCRTQVRRCLTALEDSAVLVNAIDATWRPRERRDAMAPEGRRAVCPHHIESFSAVAPGRCLQACCKFLLFLINYINNLLF